MNDSAASRWRDAARFLVKPGLRMDIPTDDIRAMGAHRWELLVDTINRLARQRQVDVAPEHDTRAAIMTFRFTPKLPEVGHA